MLDPKEFYNILKNEGVNFITGVPDSLLNEFCLYVSENLSNREHILAANEGNAVAIAAGHYISKGTIPLVYMQNSGIGNAINPLISLTNKETYSIPMILLIGWRGAPGVEDWAHHMKQGRETTSLLEILDIPYKVLEDKVDNTREMIKWAIKISKENSSPVALLVKKGILESGKKKDLLKEQSKFTITREEAIEHIIDSVPKDSIFVATTGRATREIYEVRNKKGHDHNRDFLNIGSMGHASSIALGLAIGNKNRLVVCLDGDASAIMHMGALTINGSSNNNNFLHIVLNNGSHESVGGQDSVGHKIDFTKIAKYSGYSTMGRPIDNKEDLSDAINTLIKREGPFFIDLHIKKGIRSGVPLLKIDLCGLKKQMMMFLNQDDIK